MKLNNNEELDVLIVQCACTWSTHVITFTINLTNGTIQTYSYFRNPPLLPILLIPRDVCRSQCQYCILKRESKKVPAHIQVSPHDKTLTSPCMDDAIPAALCSLTRTHISWRTLCSKGLKVFVVVVDVSVRAAAAVVKESDISA